jgi:hypothetical protein
MQETARKMQLIAWEQDYSSLKMFPWMFPSKTKGASLIG